MIIAVPEKYHDEIVHVLKRKGFFRIFKVSLEYMSKVKGQYLLRRQENYPQLSFMLTEDRFNTNWLNMTEKKSGFPEDSHKTEKKYHCKFPTLFYLDEKTVFKKAAEFDYENDYKKICGSYKCLHMQPVRNVQKTEAGRLSEILNIYMVFSKWDSIKAAFRQYEPWIYPIQAGSRITDHKSEKLSDGIGDNISGQNRLFAEMTAAYWIWKNRDCSKYKGICHYRRHFIISEEEIMSLDKNGIDVILTTPRYVPCGIRNMFLAETPVNDKVYRSMICALSEICPEDREKFEVYMDSGFYYPNNMVVARNEIYDSYCAWIFPVLFRMAEIDVENRYGNAEDRHIAYAAELLTSYYFVKSKEKYCIAVTDYQLLLDNQGENYV